MQSDAAVKVAIVGMTGSGKTVLISTLATKMAQMALEDIFMAPFGDNRRRTLLYTQSNWQTLNHGRWPASTPAGELIELQWELNTKNNQALVQFLDCAGQDIRALFRTDIFDSKKLKGDLKTIYENISSANILIFLVNMKDLLATPNYVDEIMDLDLMFHTLNQRNNIPRKMAVVFSQYDKYKPEVDQKFKGDFLEYLRHYIPYLHGQYIRKRNFEIIPVAAVYDTQSIIENNEVKQYPAPEFSSYNLETLIHWIADSVEELAPEVKKRAPKPKPPKPPVAPKPSASVPPKTSDPKQAPKKSYYYAIGITISAIVGVIIGFILFNNANSYSDGPLVMYALSGAITGVFSFFILTGLVFWVLPGLIIGAWQGIKIGAKLGIILGPIAGMLAALTSQSSAALQMGLGITAGAFLGIIGISMIIGAISGMIEGPNIRITFFKDNDKNK